MKKLILLFAFVYWLGPNTIYSQTYQTYLPDTFQVLIDNFCMLEFHLHNHAEPNIDENIDTLIKTFADDIKYLPESMFDESQPIQILYSRTKYIGDLITETREIEFLDPERYTEFIISENELKTSSSFLNFETIILFPLHKNQLMKLYIGSMNDLNEIDSINFTSLINQALSQLKSNKKLMNNHQFESRVTLINHNLYNKKSRTYTGRIDTANIAREDITVISKMEISFLYKPGVTLINNTLTPDFHVSLNYINKRKGIPAYSIGLNWNSFVIANPDAELGIDFYNFLNAELYIPNYRFNSYPNQSIFLNGIGYGLGRLIYYDGDMYPSNTWRFYLFFSMDKYDLFFGSILMNPQYKSFKEFGVSDKQQNFIGIRFNI